MSNLFVKHDPTTLFAGLCRKRSDGKSNVFYTKIVSISDNVVHAMFINVFVSGIVMCTSTVGDVYMVCSMFSINSSVIITESEFDIAWVVYNV